MGFVGIIVEVPWFKQVTTDLYGMYDRHYDYLVKQIHSAVRKHLGMQPQVLCSVRQFRTASGMAPIPICRVLPSSTSSATYRPIACETSSGLDGA